MNTEISKFKVYWLVLIPTKGKATKKTVSALNKDTGYAPYTRGVGCIYRHFTDLSKIDNVLSSIGEVIDKEYYACVITDAQFSKMNIDHAKGTTTFPFTDKQKSEMLLIEPLNPELKKLKNEVQKIEENEVQKLKNEVQKIENALKNANSENYPHLMQDYAIMQNKLAARLQQASKKRYQKHMPHLEPISYKYL